MKQFTAEQIQKRFETLPQEIKDAIASTDVHDALKAISTKYSLHIDQQGELVDQVGLVMLGLSPAKSFVSNLSQAAEIDAPTAAKIAADINSQVLDKIRSSMRAFEEKAEEEKPQSPIGISNRNFSNVSLERAGNFTIEHEALSNVPPSAPKKSVNLLEPEVTEADHAAILHGIENPPSRAASKETREDREHYEPLVDQLLNAPAAIPQEKIVRIAADMGAPKPPSTAASAVKPSTPKPPVNLPTGDPYREPIK
jgi:hypothetical protein